MPELPRDCACRSAAAEATVEYGVKAAFLLNFTKFIAWPTTAFSDAQSTIEICVMGKDPFGRILDDVVQGESVNGRKLQVRRINQPAGSANMPGTVFRSGIERPEEDPEQSRARSFNRQ